MAGALALTSAASASAASGSAASGSAAKDSHQAQVTSFPALAAGAHILASGSNRYGSYEIIEQPAVASHATSLIMRPDNGGGCNTGAWILVCANLIGTGLKISEMTNETTFPWRTGTAEVQILNPGKSELASWYGNVSQSNTVTAYWTPNPNVNQPSGWYCATSYWYGQTTGTDTASRCVQVT